MFTLIPNLGHAKEARKLQSDRVKKSISFLLKEFIKKIEIDNSDLDMTLNKLHTIERLFPELHHMHHSLQSSMRQQNVDRAKTEFHKIINEIKLKKNNQKLVLSVSSISDTEWESYIAKEAVRLTEEDCGRKAVIKPIEINELNKQKDYLFAALNLIARHDYNMFDEFSEQVNTIKLFQGEVTMGLTDVRMLGAMFIRTPGPNLDPVLYYFEHIIHEASHIHLNCLMAIDPIILNTSEERFTSPLRPDLRPMVGVFHATFVSARVARSLALLHQATHDAILLQALAESIDEVIRGLEEINAGAKLTDKGKIIVQEMTKLTREMTRLPWNNYDFTAQRVHRFGAGFSKVDSFANYYHENYL